jgi:hypothetical protein
VFVSVGPASAAIWLVITPAVVVLLLATDPLSFVGSLFLMAITVVGVAIPTPGGAGGFQFFMDLRNSGQFFRTLSFRPRPSVPGRRH